MKFQAVLFDVIGTTVIEKDPDVIINCFKKAFLKHGISADESEIRSNRGKDKMEMINKILVAGYYPVDLGIPIFDSFRSNINENIDNFIAADNAVDVFEALRKSNIKIGLGTGLPQIEFYKILKHLGWNLNDFQYIGISEVIGKARPDPAMIYEMMTYLKIDRKTEFLKVGDTLADIQEGKNAGVITVGILQGTQSKEQLMNARPDFLIQELSEVLEIVAE